MLTRQLLFLFSALGAINGFFLAAYFFIRKPARMANWMLGALLLAVGVRTAKSVLLYFEPSIALAFRQLGLSACLLIGPFTYLYVRYYFAEVYSRSSDRIWRVHLTLSFGLISIGIVFPYSAHPSIWDRASIFIHAYWLVYLVATARLLWFARARLLELKRVRKDVLLPLSSFVGSAVILAAYASTPFTSYIVGALSCTFSVHIAVLAFLLHRQSEGAVEKYGNHKLADDDASNLLAALGRLMDEQKPYLNPNLTLSQLARRAGYPQSAVSQAINDKLDKSFSVYINGYRVADARRLLAAEPQLNLNIVAERCGFNSSSTFFAAFKKLTGRTPAAFRASPTLSEVRNRDFG